MNKKFIRFLDIILSFLGLIFLFPVILLITTILFYENQSPFFLQKRVGKNKKLFILFKFRTMPLDTLSKATHLIKNVKISRFSRFLRKSKLDELPQLINVFIGQMSLVGSRPCLESQSELIKERMKFGLYKFKPGITGLAQLKSIDMSQPKLLAKTDHFMMKNFSLRKYIFYLIYTAIGKGIGDNIKYDPF
tara:strand:- start:636 stop:1208 length:573 start_codon:yes stop_codon:yes gene_type:complete